MRILVVEDDDVIADGLKASLERAQFVADVARDGDRGLELAMC